MAIQEIVGVRHIFDFHSAPAPNILKLSDGETREAGKRMKILLCNVAAGDDNDPFVMDMLLPAWEKNFDLVRDKDTELTARFSRWGIHGQDAFFFHYMDTLNSQHVFQQALHAQEEGYDGVLVMCFGDPMLDHIRQAIDIPVVGLGESAMYQAARMGNKFGIVAISDLNAIELDHTVHKYGLSDKFVGCASINETAAEQGAVLVNAQHGIEHFEIAARKLVERGAEVVIPGCGLLSPGLRLAIGCEDKYPGGITEVDGAAVVDLLSVGLLTAQSIIKLAECGSAWISRKNLYAQATEEALESGKMTLKDERISFWDVEL